MTKKTVGYVELEWQCPNCGGRNAGRAKICANCGSPQPQDVSFEQAAEEKLIEDAVVIDQAKLGADIHCAYCGTRNPAGAKTCIQCGADLAEGSAREAGKVLGGHKDQPAAEIKCTYCGSMNPGTAHTCYNCGATLVKEQPQTAPEPVPQGRRGGVSTAILIGIGVAIVAACIGLFIFLNKTDDVQGRVNKLSWERSIVIMGLAPVSREGWWDEIPQQATPGACRQEQRYTSADPRPNSTEVCGTPYTVDTGSGLGEVVQDCEYLVYDDRCEYTVLQLQPVDTLVLSGSDQNPQWPEPRLNSDQEEGQRQESYLIVFDADGETFTYRTNDVEKYQQFVPGSRWMLKVNQLGGVTAVEPVP